jgi:hypothetical protein
LESKPGAIIICDIRIGYLDSEVALEMHPLIMQANPNRKNAKIKPG